MVCSRLKNHINVNLREGSVAKIGLHPLCDKDLQVVETTDQKRSRVIEHAEWLLRNKLLFLFHGLAMKFNQLAGLLSC
jgi:hypothetical protein